MNGLKKHLLSARTVMDLILAQISYAALLAYLSFNLGKLASGGKKSRSAVTRDFSRAVSAREFIIAKLVFWVIVVVVVV